MLFGIVACGVVATGAGLLGYPLLPSFNQPEQVGRPATFVLRNLQGEEVSDTDLNGALALVYFATSACPERCVLEFDRLTAAIGALGARGVAVRPVFITLDPIEERTQKMAALIERFDPRTVVLTGSAKQLDAVFRLFGVRATSDGTGVPAVLVDRAGTISAIIDPAAEETDIAAALRDRLE
jgi:protein SCO1/2